MSSKQMLGIQSATSLESWEAEGDAGVYVLCGASDAHPCCAVSNGAQDVCRPTLSA